ncbi:MAG: spermidine synthase, partial [Chloroflexota bacterium]
TLATAYATAPTAAGTLAAWQLAGGGAAVVLSPVLLNVVGPANGALASGALFGAGGLVLLAPALREPAPAVSGRAGRLEGLDDDSEGGWTAGSARALTLGIAGLCAVTSLAALPLNLALAWLALDPATVNSPKSLFTSIRDPQLREVVVHREWDSVARTDVSEPAHTVDLKWVYVDGNPTGIMYRAGDSGPGADVIRADIGYVPFALPGSREKVLVIGAGAGEEVLAALLAGAQEVVAAEVSPGLIRAVQRFGTYTGQLFDQPEVRVINQDGRTFLRATGEQFDVIYLSLAAGGVAQPAGAVSGSYLYTLEAFDDYLAHLRPDGRLVIKLHDEPELARAFNTAFQALTRRGATPVEAIRRLLAVNNGPLAERSGGGVALPLLMVRKTPYAEDEARAAYETLRQTPFPPLFVPYLESLSPLSAFAAEDVGPAVIEAQVPFDIRPATDTSPFFFRLEKGLPWGLLLAPALLSLVTGGVLLFTRRPAPDVIDVDGDSRNDRDDRGDRGDGGVDEAASFLDDDVPWRFIVFAGVAGAGFTLVQLPLLHRLPALIGHPTLGFAIVSGVLLFSGAAGGLLAQGVRLERLRPAIGWAALAAALFAVAHLELVAMASEATRGQGVVGRAVAAGLLALPLGLCA